MKRDLDLIRGILLFVEDKAGINKGVGLNELLALNANRDLVAYQLELLSDAGFIDAEPMKGLGGYLDFYIRRLTYNGHEYLDSIRDETIWEKTKEKLAMVGGASTLVVVKELAVSISKNLLGI